MYDKIAPILTYFTRIGFLVESTNTVVKTESQNELLWLYNAARRSLNLKEIDRASLHNKLKTASPVFRRHLLVSLGLDELGFGPSLWDKSAQNILTDVKLAIEGGLLSILSSNNTTPSLMSITEFKPQGIKKIDPLSRVHTKLEIEQIVVAEEAGLNISVNLPFSGFVRVLALEEGDVVGLNEEIGLPTERLDLGVYEELNVIELTKTVPRTTIFTLASHSPEISHWPADLSPKSAIDVKTAADLARNFVAMDPQDRACRVISVLTV